MIIEDRARGDLTLASVPSQRLIETLSSRGIVLNYGAFRVRLRTALPEFAPVLARVYPHFPFRVGGDFVDASIELRPRPGLRRRVRPLASLEVDGIDPFGPFPRTQLLPNFEWGVNWAFANLMNAHLLLHAGALEVDGKGVLLVARPTSGKSTLTAGLVGRGARLLSDEFGVIRASDGQLIPMIKPIALKNEAIAAVQNWSPSAVMGPTFLKTRKGNLAHHAVPEGAVQRADQPVQPALIIFPQYRVGARRTLFDVGKARAFLELGSNSFNYEILGPHGFKLVGDLVGSCPCYRFEYESMQDAVETVLALCRAAHPGPIAVHD